MCLALHTDVHTYVYLGVTLALVQTLDPLSFPHIPAVSLHLYAKNTTFILKGAASHTQA